MSKSRRQKDLATIHIAKKELGLSEGEYRAAISGVMDELGMPAHTYASSANLSARGRALLIKGFRRAGWSPRPERDEPPRYAAHGQRGMITPKQAGLIKRLEDQLGWTAEPQRLLGFVRRQLGYEAEGALSKGISMLTSDEASKVITGLQRLTGERPHPRSRRTASQE